MATQDPTSTGQQIEPQQAGEKAKEGSQPKAEQQSSLQPARPRRGLSRRQRGYLSPYDLLSAGPFELMRRLTSDFDRMFEGMIPDVFGGEEQQLSAFMPEVDVMQREGELVVRADLPGMKKEDLKIELMGNSLVLEGERRSEEEREERGYYRSERSYGQFRRVIPLPENVNVENASASFNDGVLEVKVKLPDTQRKRIEIGEGKQEKQVEGKTVIGEEPSIH